MPNLLKYRRRAGLLALLTMAMLTPAQGYAGDFYLDLGAGVTQFTCTICKDDGTWVQTGMPNQQAMTSFAYRMMGGYRAGNYSLQLGYLSMGSAKIDTTAVADHFYDAITHQCVSHCETANRFYTRDRSEGGELSITRHFKVGPVEPFIRLGGAMLHHQLEAWSASWDDGHTLKFHGWIPTALIGGGLCSLGSIQVCLDATYYRGMGGRTDWQAGLPISKEALVTLFGVRYTF